MILTEDTLRFIREHADADVHNLALQAAKYKNVDFAEALTQIAGRQVAREKIPSWWRVDSVRYPQRLSLEQCSSEATARYKAMIVEDISPARAETLTDLTGGLGVDCSFLSSAFSKVTYVERQSVLCDLAAHNFLQLGLKHIDVVQANAETYLRGMHRADWIFIDPARRDSHGEKTVAIADCEPDVQKLEPLLLEKARWVLVKLSPMLDLSLALQHLSRVQEAHIVSVNNECKELLLLLGHEALPKDDVRLCCINLLVKKGSTLPESMQRFVFTRAEEQQASCVYATYPETYLYEPNASLLKAGAFRSVASRYGVKKLHPSSHLYTSETCVKDFPGRKFRVEACCTFGKKELKSLLKEMSKANLSVRNFPLSVAELRKKLKLSEGGEDYLFATTLSDGSHVLIHCRKAD